MRNTASSAANIGVNSLVSTGAILSSTPCLDSASHAATTTAPAAPHGTSQSPMNWPASRPMAANIPAADPAKTPPPSAISP